MNRNMKTASRIMTALPWLTLPVLTFLLFSFRILEVRDISMTPVLNDGDTIIVNRWDHRLRAGDIAVFRHPGDGRLVVKRVVLGPGDPITIDGSWLQTGSRRFWLTGDQRYRLRQWDTVPRDSWFAVGDNQFASVDSRDYGFLSRRSLLGKVLLHD